MRGIGGQLPADLQHRLTARRSEQAPAGHELRRDDEGAGPGKLLA